MDTSYSLNAYRSHDLNISMKTSSGDVIKMDFANESALSMNSQKNSQGSQEEFSFSSMQSFNYSIKSNGIDEQDKKEIEAFMKIAQPYIDNFLKELSEDAPTSPVTKMAKDIASIFEPSKLRDENQSNQIKSSIVDLFDNSITKIKATDDIFLEMQKLLERTLKEFEDFNKKLYA
ncbi:MAG TPA: hypothetical protein VLZ29_07305 [Sulfurimonas sp.]|uniref:hypothetical protein n=1 Tax=Sulfurimonas sp. TaxID=2022749 RepID=UPI002BD4D912|nr:hypothetical protein [Sulfurimonas sp.]HUH42905.1 hypothetical protein [Sulfurimonas sp.]